MKSARFRQDQTCSDLLRQVPTSRKEEAGLILNSEDVLQPRSLSNKGSKRGALSFLPLQTSRWYGMVEERGGADSTKTTAPSGGLVDL